MKLINNFNPWQKWNYRQYIELVFCFIFCFLLLLAGCQDTLYIPFISQTTPTMAVEASLQQEIAPTTLPEIIIKPVQTSTVTPNISIWVPPLFDPNANTDAGRLLKARIQTFVDQNPGIDIDVRVKGTSGPGGLLDALAATNAAAPDALPSLVLLSRSNMEVAALKGLIVSLNGLTNEMENPDWYPYARQMASLQESQFGLPFAADVLLLMYRPGLSTSVPSNWDVILRQRLPVLFPAADPQAVLTFFLYLSLEGQIVDSQQRPMIEPEILYQVLNLYSDGVVQGVFSGKLIQYRTDIEVWQAYQESRVCCAVTWASHYLSELPVDSLAISLPSLGDNNFTMADGWLWALSDPNPEHRELSVRLAEFLVDSDFLAEWSTEAGYLPTRPSALALWQNYGLQTLFNEVSLKAQIFPTNDLFNSLGSKMEEATLQVLQQKIDPNRAAQTAAEQLNNLE